MMTVVQSTDGSPLFIASEVGIALGYGDDGRRLRDSVQGEWADRLRPRDVRKLSGEELAPLKSSGVVAPNTPALVLLTESGLYRVLMLSGKPAALRLQEWLADEVLPALRATGSYGRPRLDSEDAGAKCDAAAAAGEWRIALSFMKLKFEAKRREAKQRKKDANERRELASEPRAPRLVQ
jgi:prophage antirepressor-like protein